MASMNERYALDQRNGFDTRVLEQFRKSLLVERACVERRLIEAELAISRQHSGLGDDAEARLDLDVAVALAAAARRALVDISEALGRFDSGKFGICAGCGKLIALERLKAWPRARFCVHCE
jgi:RNA polymerase-binding transcription factor DksA